MIAVPQNILDQCRAIVDRSTAELIDALAHLQPFDQSPEMVSPLIFARGDAEKARWSALSALSMAPTADMPMTSTSRLTFDPTDIIGDRAKLAEATLRIDRLERDLAAASGVARQLETEVARLQFDNVRLRELVSAGESQRRDGRAGATARIRTPASPRRNHTLEG